MKMKTKRRYTDELKAQAVKLAKLGKPVSEVAKDLEITADLVYRWKKEDELRTLRREVAHLKRENDILKKAAIILGTTPQLKGA